MRGVRKGQFWYADFVIGVLVIGFIAVLFARTVINVPERGSEISLLSGDAMMVGNLLMTPGVNNAGWSSGQGKIGLVENGKVNNIWLNDFFKLVEQTQPDNGYLIARSLMGTEHDFAVYFQDKNGNVLNNKAYGGIDDLKQLESLEADNIVRVSRVVYFDENNDGKGQIVNMIIVVWDYGKEKRTSKIVCENAQNNNLCGALCFFIQDYAKGCQTEWMPVVYCGGAC